MRAITTVAMGGFALAVLACGDRFTSVEPEPGAGGAGGASAATNASAAATGGSGGSGGMTGCPPNGVGHLRDDFENGSLSPQWEVAGDGQAGENGGTGYIALSAEMHLDTYVVSVNSYSLAQCDAVIEIEQLPNDPDCDATFGVIDAQNAENWAWMGAFGEQLFVESYSGGQLVDETVVVLPEDAEYWRVRDRNGQLAFATSDGTSWSVHLEFSTPGWADDVRLELHASGQPSSGTREFRFDNLNQGP